MIGLLLPRLRTTLLLFGLMAAIPVFAVPTTSHSSDDWTDPDKWEIEHAISSDEGIDNPDFSPLPPPVVQNSSCDNLAGTSPTTFIGTNTQWGQTYIPTVACEGTNNQFESITFEREGNGTAVFTLEIFDGAVLSGTPKYTVTGLQTSQGGGDPTWNLAGGTGDRTFVMGQTYTFLFTKTGGSGVQIHYSPDETSGQAINNGAFDPNIDLRFAVNSSSNAQGTSCDNLAGTTPVTFIGTNNQWDRLISLQ